MNKWEEYEKRPDIQSACEVTNENIKEFEEMMPYRRIEVGYFLVSSNEMGCGPSLYSADDFRRKYKKLGS